MDPWLWLQQSLLFLGWVMAVAFFVLAIAGAVILLFAMLVLVTRWIDKLLKRAKL